MNFMERLIVERFCYIEPWENLQNGEHQSVASLSLRLAKERGVRLRVCVVSIKNCSQFLEKCFGDSVSKKLRNRKEFLVDGVTIQLETERTLKKNLSDQPTVNLLLSPSESLLTQVESMRSSHVVLVFSETLHSEHLKGMATEELSEVFGSQRR